MNAIDSSGKICRNFFEIEVVDRADLSYINHQFSMTLEMSFKRFYQDVEQRMDVSRKVISIPSSDYVLMCHCYSIFNMLSVNTFQLASVYGDSDLSNIVVNRVSEGSVIYAWHNKSLQTHDGSCPVNIIKHLVRYMINDDDTLNMEFKRKMLPYVVRKAGAVPRGSCEERPTAFPSITPSKDEIGPIPDSENDILFTVIVPAVVLACMLLIACCIACCLYRRKRKGDLTDDDQHTFINRGIPIIFADELEDKPETPTKPLILKNEKPPFPPPHYPQSLDSMPSSPESEKKDGFYSTDDMDDMMSPLYRPPPPLTGSHDPRRDKAQAQPTYRRPPPYIPL